MPAASCEKSAILRDPHQLCQGETCLLYSFPRNQTEKLHLGSASSGSRSTKVGIYRPFDVRRATARSDKFLLFNSAFRICELTEILDLCSNCASLNRYQSR